MKEFVLDPDMLNMGGVFYPTGHAVVLFPEADHARQVADGLLEAGFADDQVQLLKPATILREISRTEEGSDAPLPSVGTEGATVRMYEEMARQGHHGLVVAVESSEDDERLMQVVRKFPFAVAKKYRMLVIQDLD